jgi:hypothetical protein
MGTYVCEQCKFTLFADSPSYMVLLLISTTLPCVSFHYRNLFQGLSTTIYPLNEVLCQNYLKVNRYHQHALLATVITDEVLIIIWQHVMHCFLFQVGYLLHFL